MSDYKYKFDFSIPDAKTQREQVTQQGIGARPADEQEPMDKGFYESMYDAIMSYFDNTEEADRVLTAKEIDKDRVKGEVLREFDALDSLLSKDTETPSLDYFDGIDRDVMEDTVQAQADRIVDTAGATFEKPSGELIEGFKDVTDTEEGKLTNVKPLEELAEAIDPGTIDTESLDADGGASTSGKGLMSRPITPEQREALLEMGDITKAQQFSIESDGSFSKQKLTDVVDSSVGNLNKRAALEGMIDVEVGSTGPRTEDSYNLENLSNFTGTWRQRSINAGILDQNGRPTKLAQDLNRQGQLGDTIFDVQYAGRNGNGDIESGDGSRFKGRGLVQLTGRGNYQAVQDILQAQGIDVDLINNPELVNDNRYALPAALAYLEHSGFTDEAADNMSARSLQLAINPSAPVETAEERWESAITSLRVEDPEAADEMEKRNEYAAQRTVGTSVDGIIGDGSIRAMRGWLQENNITIPEDATNMDLVVLVNENA